MRIALCWVLFSFSLAFGSRAAWASGLQAHDDAVPGAFPLVADGVAAVVLVDPDEPAVVREVAAPALSADVRRVVGHAPAVEDAQRLDADGPAVVIGTLGRSDLIDQLVQAGLLDVADLAERWEAFKIVVIPGDAATPGGALVVVGSDRRGTAYGVFEVARAIGVSPWSWWADVPVTRRPALHLTTDGRRTGPPKVKYRGVFLNDEGWGLNPWAAQTYEPEVGDIGPKTYAAIFELLLRLRANYLWPAMHPCTLAFNQVDGNKEMADRYAIVMGSSHAEPMLRNNVTEWAIDGRGDWNYLTNREVVLGYWESRVRSNAGFENLYTVGMRGIHDGPMAGGGALEAKVRVMDDIFAQQRAMLARHTGRPADQAPQVFWPYKEVLAIYEAGLVLPDDVTLGWTDDNFGYIRRFSTASERARAGGAGVYYHLSYWGAPHDYLWLNTVAPALVWAEMTKAAAYGADRVWVANVGDIKPIEIGMDWFLRLAWDPDAYGPGDAHRFLEAFFAENLGEPFAKEAAAILREHYRLSFVRKPEHMGWTRVYPEVSIDQQRFSPWAQGDEVRQRLEAFDGLQARAEGLQESLPDALRDAGFQLVLYPVRGAANMNRKHLYAQLSRDAAGHGWPVANRYADLAVAAYDAIQADTAYFNEEMSGGKWAGMMHSSPRDLAVFAPPEVGRVEVADARGGLAVRVEGSAAPARAGGEPADAWAEPGSPNRLPQVDGYTRRAVFVDLINTGAELLDWRAETSHPWVRLDAPHGTVDLAHRLRVTVDFDRAPRVDAVEVQVSVHAGERSFVLVLPVRNPSQTVAEGTFVQSNGAIGIHACHYASATETRRGDHAIRWRRIDDLGYSGAVMALAPWRFEPETHLTPRVDAPELRYPIHVIDGGAARICFKALPTHRLRQGEPLAIAYSISDGAPKTVAFEHGNDEHNRRWAMNVLRNAMTAEDEVELPAGDHVLTVYGLGPGVVLDQVHIEFEGHAAPSYLGPRETCVGAGSTTDPPQED